MEYDNSAELFEIPAAEQEITVGSNDQSSTNLLANSGLIPSSGVIPISGAGPTTLPVGYQTPGARGPRVIMVQRSGQAPGVANTGSANFQRSGLKTVKIITVPGQGVGGKPLKAAVIPMHMLQRSMVSLGSNTGSAISPAVSSVPRVLTIRSSPQVVASCGAVMGSGPSINSRPTIILSSAHTMNNLNSASAYHSNEEIDSSLFMNTANIDGLAQSHSGVVATPSGYYDLATGMPVPAPMSANPYGHPISPTGRDSADEQEQVSTGLKTNGLRRYARCVCNKVRDKGITSYSEVADELVHEYAAEHPMIPSEQLHYIQKNIRRRVYDALNVLMALNVLQKEKKEIRWVGLPVNMIEECRRLEEEREKRQLSLRNKTVEIQDLILQLIAFKNLVMRNRINDRYRRNQFAKADDTKVDDCSSPNSPVPRTEKKIPLPFLVISTHRKTVIDCNISNDKLEYLFNFDQAFEIRDEVDTLKRMGLMLRLGSIHCTQEEYNQCLELVPPSLRFYVEAIYERRQAIIPDFEALHQQRRLFVEARLAAAASQAARQTDENGEPLMQNGAGVNADHSGGMGSMHASRSLEGSHYGSGLYNTGTVGSSESTLRQLYLARSVEGADDSRLGLSISSVPSSGFVPGDTQHYARAAASRGYVVPGGPGGLLRHRQHPSVSSVSVNQPSLTEHHFSTGSTPAYRSSSSLARGLIRSVTSEATNIVESEHHITHHKFDDNLNEADDELMVEPVDDDEDDDDDDDMEEV